MLPLQYRTQFSHDSHHNYPPPAYQQAAAPLSSGSGGYTGNRDSQAATASNYPAAARDSQQQQGYGGYGSKEAKSIQQPSPYIEQWSTEEVGFNFNQSRIFKSMSAVTVTVLPIKYRKW